MREKRYFVSIRPPGWAGRTLRIENAPEEMAFAWLRAQLPHDVLGRYPEPFIIEMFDEVDVDGDSLTRLS